MSDVMKKPLSEDKGRERRIAQLAKLMECDPATLKPWLEQMAAKRDAAEKDLERLAHDAAEP